MEADFSGWATKAGIRCSDGRTIMPGAFAHQDSMTVPLVWQHGHSDPTNVLGHAILTDKPEGVWCEGFFNETPNAQHAKTSLQNGDFNSLSIWANELIEKSKRVLHGAIREVSLVLSGANPGAKIENVTLRHGNGDLETLDEEAIIKFGESVELQHSETTTSTSTIVVERTTEPVVVHADDEVDDETVQDVYDSMTPKQKEVLHFMIGEALNASGGSSAEHSNLEELLHGNGEESVQDVFDSLDDTQKQLLFRMVGEASTGTAQHTNLTDQENTSMHNIFENGGGVNLEHAEKIQLFHSNLEEIKADATKSHNGSLKDSITEWALAHGIEDIDILFPEARALTDTPEIFGRRTEWVAKLLNGVKKSPFSRIKTLSADITAPEARAKGYIKGSLKKEEFFKVAKRVTEPTTIYKKQKLDRDDIVDITDFDVVVWLKGEMRIMLDEELARAILVGDGRDAGDPDKIDEDKIRPIASDHELYVTTINVNIDDASSNMNEVFDAIMLNRKELRGTGLPTLYTTETYIAKTLLQRDSLGRRIYKTLDEVATEARVAEIVPVEILEEYPDIVAILVNPIDYVVGADRGGNVAMFDDFDIDYNQFKYLIETRCSGALIKMKCAMVVRKVAGADVLITPTAPTFDGTAVTIPTQTGVTYRNADTDAVLTTAGGPYAVAEGETLNVVAEAASGKYFASSEVDDWSFTNTGA